MKILLITTGGTIGSVCKDMSVDVNSRQPDMIAQAIRSACPDAALDILSPLELLSERLSAADLNTLAAALFGAELRRYDGVIVTVGSDNLAYLSAFVGLLFGRLPLPIAVVAADRVLSDPGSNGHANLYCAAELIRQGLCGTYVPYRNSDGSMLIHEAVDLRQADLSDSFFSFHGAFGIWDGALRILRDRLSVGIPAVFDAQHLPRICDNVLLLHPYPLQDYERLEPDGVSAVLHTLYHSGTVDSGRLAAFMKKHPRLPVWLASLRSGRPLYRTTEEIIEAGAVPLFDIAPECAYIKLLLACAQDRMSIRGFMEETV